MEHVSKLLGASGPRQQSTVSDPRQASNAPMAVMNRLWLRMAEIFGHKWVSSYGETPNESWCRCLAGVDPGQIATGLNALLDRSDPWPPTAIEFRNLCLGSGDGLDWERRGYRVVDPRSMIEDKTTKERNLAERRECFAKFRRETGF